MLSDYELGVIYTKAAEENKSFGIKVEIHAALRAVAEAAVKDAVGGEPVAWLHNLENFQEPRMRPLDENEISRGWTQKPLYTRPQASAAVPEGLLIAIQSHCDDLKRTAAIVRKILPAFENTASEIDLAANELLAMLAASQPEVR